MNCPCKDCKDRAVNCHAECERYGEYAKEREKIRKARQDEQNSRAEHQMKCGCKYVRKWEY